METCVHCNQRHGIFEDWAKCNEKRVFDANLDKWAKDIAEKFDAAYWEAETRRRVFAYARVWR